MKIYKIEKGANKKTIFGAIYYLIYEELKFVKYLYRFIYGFSVPFMFFMMYVSFSNKWWIFLAFKCVITFFLLKKAYTYYRLDKAGIYDNTTFADEISKFMFKEGKNGYE